MSSENNTPDILLYGFGRRFPGFAQQLFGLETNALYREYFIIVLGEAGYGLADELVCDYIICPQSLELSGRIKCSSVITCGMNTRCTLSFSSIDGDKALLSVNRRIDFGEKSIHQCERPVDYYEAFSAYENLVLQGLTILTM